MINPYEIYRREINTLKYTSFDSLSEFNLTYSTRVLALKRCGKIQLAIFLSINKIGNYSNHLS